MNILTAERIIGFMPLGYLELLAEEASKHQSIVEVGCWRGRSTRVLCDNCPGKVTAVDTWRGSPELVKDMRRMEELTNDPDWVFSEFLRNMDGVKNLEIWRGGSLEAAQYFAHVGRTFDLVFIDALHDYDSVLADLKAWWPLVNSCLSGHDFMFPDVRAALETVFPATAHAPNNADMWVVRK